MAQRPVLSWFINSSVLTDNATDAESSGVALIEMSFIKSEIVSLLKSLFVPFSTANFSALSSSDEGDDIGGEGVPDTTIVIFTSFDFNGGVLSRAVVGAITGSMVRKPSVLAV